MSLITYEDKTALNENSQIADVNKVTANDMNMIKNAINNLFPVGFIIEVDNADFNPNTYWGGTWERDKGHVIVSVDEDDTDFSTSGKTGGEKEHYHQYGIQYTPFYGALVGEDSAINIYDGQSKKFVGTSINGNVSTSINNGLVTQGRNYIASIMEGTTNTTSSSSMPPYRTAYRWIKTAM